MSTDQPEDFSLAEFIAYVDEFGHSEECETDALQVLAAL